MPKHVTVASHEPLQPTRQGMWKRDLVDQPPIKVVEWFFEKGIETKPHGHDATQAAYQVSGKFELTLEGEVSTLVAGDAYFIPPGAAHGLRCVEKGSYIVTTVNTAPAPKADHSREHDDHAHAAHGHDESKGHRH